MFLNNIDLLKEFNSLNSEIKTHFLNLKVKYPDINKLSEKEIELLFTQSQKIDISNNSYRLEDDCDKKFNQQMTEIHNNYDNAISMCNTATLWTGGLASPCYVYAVTNAVFQSAVAIDNHTICKGKL